MGEPMTARDWILSALGVVVTAGIFVGSWWLWGAFIRYHVGACP